MIAGTEAEYQSDAESTKETPNLTLTCQPWGVFCEYLWENLPCYKGTALYMFMKWFSQVWGGILVQWEHYTTYKSYSVSP